MSCLAKGIPLSLQSPQGLPNAVQEQARTVYKEARQVCPKLHPIATEVDVFSVNIEEEANSQDAAFLNLLCIDLNIVFANA